MKITLVPYSGLCNRLYMLVSAMELQTICPDYEMEIYWEKTYDCKAWFDELFLPIQGVNIHRLKHLYLRHRGKDLLGLPVLLRKFIFDADLKCRKIAATDLLLSPPYMEEYLREGL